MKKIIILACSCFLLAACGNSAKTNKSTSADSTATQTVDIHNAETSLDYEGTYKGVFPAADCPGIETTLTLNADRHLPFIPYTSTGTAHLTRKALIHWKATS